MALHFGYLHTLYKKQQFKLTFLSWSRYFLQISGAGLSNMAQDSFQDEIHLHGHCVCLGFQFRTKRGIHDSYWKGRFATFT